MWCQNFDPLSFCLNCVSLTSNYNFFFCFDCCVCVYLFSALLFQMGQYIKISIVISQLYIMDKKVQYTIIRRIPIVFFDKSIIITIPIILLYEFTYIIWLHHWWFSVRRMFFVIRREGNVFRSVCLSTVGEGVGQTALLDRPSRIGQNP